MKHTKRIAGLGIVTFLLAIAGNISAQGSCPDFVKQVMNTTSNLCANTGSNQVCYGNQDVSVQPANASFSSPGALMDVAAIQSLQVSGAGAAYMHVKADLPGTVVGQYVSVVVFGNVQINPVSNGNEPMQAFYFSTGIGSPADVCQGVPASGIVLQNPTHQKAQFVANGVQMSVGSTVLLQAPDAPLKSLKSLNGPTPTKSSGTTNAQHDMTVTVLRGNVQVEADGKTTTVTTGEQSTVLLANDDQPAAPPENPVQIDTLPQNDQEAISLVQEEADTNLLDPFSTPEATDITDQTVQSDQTEQAVSGAGTDQAEVTDTPEEANATDQAQVTDAQEPQDTPEITDTPEPPSAPEIADTPEPAQPPAIEPTDVPSNSSGDTGSNTGSTGNEPTTVDNPPSSGGSGGGSPVQPTDSGNTSSGGSSGGDSSGSTGGDTGS